jgi:CDP-diacylglycerol---glycerol-3-phosphate 3-phosphatidyltransferase
MAADIFKLPNLITLGRLLMLVPTAYFLARSDPNARYWALSCLAVAAVSDFFDGYFARRLNLRTQLGLILDPLSDKILAATLVILLIAFREFPYWLAAVIIGRDLMIFAGAAIVRKKAGLIIPSNLTGKYCFSAIAMLLISYILEFDFGIRLTMYLTLILIALSLFFYGQIYINVMHGRETPVFRDRPLYKQLRTIGVVAVIATYLMKFARTAGWV